MRNITKIIIHCSDTKASMDIGADEIRKWHTDPKSKGGRGWSDIGYHYVIRKDGLIELGRELETVGAHCYGHNTHSIGICYVGGYGGIDDRTDAQKTALEVLVMEMKDIFPKATVHGHNEFSDKSCPNFDVSKEFS